MTEAKKKKSGGKIFLTTLLIILLAGAAAFGAMLLYTKSVVDDSNEKILPNTSISDIDVSGMTKDEASEAVTNKVKNSSLVLKAENKQAKIPITKTEAEYDADKTASKAYGIGRDGNFYENFKAAYASKKDGTKIKMNVSISDDSAAKLIEDYTKRFNCKARNAKIRPKNGKGVIIDEQIGLKIKVDESVPAVKKALKSWKGNKAEAELEAEKKQPKYTAEDFKDMTDILGKYTTEYDKGYYGRSKNLEVGASKISDTVLQPEEQLSVYELTNPYTAENGYYRAGTYVGDETVDSYGGGMCQVSTTLYNAAIRAELEIVERECHSRTVHYVPLSADAAIYATDKDLKFKNNLETPVYIFGTAGGGDISFYIFGKETRDPNRTIEFVSIVTSVTAPTEKVTKDKELEKGKRKVEEPGQTGYTAELWKVVYKNGKEVSRKQFNSSSYRMVPRKVVEGTKKKDKDKKDKNKKGGSTSDSSNNANNQQ